ncbi:hypothetical protein BDEG_24098 [Batrachochytrium dendrobatidis JEL423]|uniref:Peptidase A1 domain-containing protein n=1 Tax=Batrachochytrium dendrobatidis (strain JEL423) TaxID=403673 RepID=A0A177WJU8_BATDL|nr:hypothetical protein BDEG_24098 [Batrachochytrium dendrobatidis JEL423]
MLITIECVILTLQAVAAVQIALESPVGITSQSSNRLSKRSPVELGGDVAQCYAIKSNVNGISLGLQVDSAISSIVVPLPSSSSDVSLTPQHTPSGEPVTIKYKGDEYNGITSTADVTIPGTRITDINLPILAVEKQSADLVGIDPNLDGIFGFGYPLLSKHHSRITAMDILYSNNVIPNNEISIQLCPYDMTSDSFINIGNTEITAKCGTDGKSVAWIQSPTTDHHTVNIKNILVNDKQVDLPEEFQQVVENGRTLYSYLQTCSTYMIFPKVVVATLVDAIVGSNAIIFKMFSQTPVTDDNRNSVVTIKLGPRDYIQRYDSEDCKFAIKAGSNDKAILGIPFMTRLELSFDRAHKRIGFGPGCGCEVATDGYPTISDHYRVLWPSSQLPEQPSTSGSDGTFIRRRKPTTTTDQVAVPENTHHTVKSHKQTLNKLD